MGSRRRWDEADRRAAVAFGEAARDAGVRRVVYLGGLGHCRSLEHLESRQEVGRLLRGAGVPTVELRASIVIGSGSASFEMLRSLVDRLPVMVTPRWVRTLAQPIAIEDVLAYLLEAVDRARSHRVARLRDRRRRRRLLPRPDAGVRPPARTPTRPDPGAGADPVAVEPLARPRHPGVCGIGRKLIDSVRNETIVHDDAAARDFSVRPRGAREAIARALANEDRDVPESRWSDEVTPPVPYGGVKRGARLVDSRARRVPAAPAAAFAPIQRIGGRTGWYSPLVLWRLRGLVDVAVGGPGCAAVAAIRSGSGSARRSTSGASRRSRPTTALRLAAEMRLPGRAWLEFEVRPTARTASSSARRRRSSQRPARQGVLVRALALSRADLRPDAALDRRRVEVVTVLTRTRAPRRARVEGWTRRAGCSSGWTDRGARPGEGGARRAPRAAARARPRGRGMDPGGGR